MDGLLEILCPTETDFISSRKFVEFERADLDNNIRWFEEHKSKYGADMDKWANLTKVFPWKNYTKWKETDLTH